MIGLCPACLSQNELLHIHHWYEPPNYVRYSICICRSCNVLLTPKYLWDTFTRQNNKLPRWMEHILPNWDLQCLFVLNKKYGLRINFNKLIRNRYRHIPRPIKSQELNTSCLKCGNPHTIITTNRRNRNYDGLNYYCPKCKYATSSPITIHPIVLPRRDRLGRFTTSVIDSNASQTTKE